MDQRNSSTLIKIKL